MILLFSRLARTYSKNGGIATGGGRIFEPVVLFIRDSDSKHGRKEKNIYKIHCYLLTIVILKYFWVDAFWNKCYR
jgi:F-type H+-transporting ATPase subunit a